MNRIAKTFALAAMVFATTAGLTYAQPGEIEIEAPREVAEGDLPSGWEVLEREVEAMGGADRYLEIKNFVATGNFSMAMMGIEGTIVRTEAAPNHLHMNIVLGPMGEMIQATDGKVAWMIQPGSDSVTILDGEMAKNMLEGADFYDRVKPRERYESAEVVGIENINDKPCYRVDLASPGGSNSVAFFEIESGHRVKFMSRSSDNAEFFDSVTELSDFREVDGVVHPFVMKQKNEGNEFVITFETFVHDAEIDVGMFSPTPEI